MMFVNIFLEGDSFVWNFRTRPTLTLNEDYIPFIGSIGFTIPRGHEELILEPVKPNLGSVLQATTRSIKKPRRPRWLFPGLFLWYKSAAQSFAVVQIKEIWEWVGWLDILELAAVQCIQVKMNIHSYFRNSLFWGNRFPRQFLWIVRFQSYFSAWTGFSRIKSRIDLKVKSAFDCSGKDSSYFSSQGQFGVQIFADNFSIFSCIKKW